MKCPSENINLIYKININEDSGEKELFPSDTTNLWLTLLKVRLLVENKEGQKKPYLYCTCLIQYGLTT